MQNVAAPGESITANSRAELDRALDELTHARDRWTALDIASRIDLLHRCMRGVVREAPGWVADACRARRIDPGSPQAGEEWLSGPMVTVHGMRRYVRALHAGGEPRPLAERRGPGGERIVQVFPDTLLDRFLYYNIRGEVWFDEAASSAAGDGEPPAQGRIYRDRAAGRPAAGGVALVLGAGNVTSIAPLDALYKLFVENRVVALKMNPVNEYVGPHLERALAPLVDGGFLRVLYGGADVGDALCRHPAVESIHLTGSDRTHDAIVWGADPAEAARRRAERRPRIDVPITSELGCVTPVIVVPGRWSDADLEFQARHVASMVAHNGSFNCNAAKVLVLPRRWDRRDAFLARLTSALRRTPPRYAYYPGAEERWRGFLAEYPQARKVGPEGDGVVPWTLIPDVPARPGEYALSREAFCGVLAQTDLEGQDAPTFLERAVDFVNESVWGTLSCVMLVHPSTRREHGPAVERALSRLRYGDIGVNAWTGVNYSLAAVTWGAHPGHTLESIGSGIGVVHNAYFFERPLKSVIRAPFRIWPKPVWFADHRTLRTVGEALTRFEGVGSPLALVRLALWGAVG